MMELLRNELDKRALRFGKRRLGSHQRAKRKREELGAVIRATRAAAKAPEKSKADKKAKDKKVGFRCFFSRLFFSARTHTPKSLSVFV